MDRFYSEHDGGECKDEVSAEWREALMALVVVAGISVSSCLVGGIVVGLITWLVAS